MRGPKFKQSLNVKRYYWDAQRLGHHAYAGTESLHAAVRRMSTFRKQQRRVACFGKLSRMAESAFHSAGIATEYVAVEEETRHRQAPGPILKVFDSHGRR